jgi:hypothetical protein
VRAIRREAHPEALAWMERALVFNPAHEETQAQIANLKKALAEGSGK